MKGKRPLPFLAAFFSLAILSPLTLPALALAGVEGTHHDVRLITGEDEKRPCGFCHIRYKSRMNGGIASVRGSAADILGSVGVFCYSCHDGTVVPTAIIEAPNGEVGVDVLTKSHGYVYRNMSEASDGLEGIQNIYGSGLRGISQTELELPVRMECTVCHDIHNSTFVPFLNKPLEELCTSCHSGKNQAGQGRWTVVEDTGSENLAHPIGMPYGYSGYDKVRDIGDEMRFSGPIRIFDVPVKTPQELGDPNIHWEMGGHLVGTPGSVSCVTCHGAHMPTPLLLFTNDEKKICSGCHGDGVNEANPGATDSYHPVFWESLPPYVHDHSLEPETSPYKYDPGTIELYVQIPSVYPLTGDGELTCRSCHDMHNGRPRSKAIIDNGAPYFEGVICTECHKITHLDKRYGGHHITSASDMSFKVKGAETLAPWAWGPGLPGDLSDGLHCVDCHTEWARSPHNW